MYLGGLQSNAYADICCSKDIIKYTKPGESKNNDTDPFDGISDEDIKTYSDLYDEAPPENDDDAVRIAGKIREWIEKDRPNMQKTKKRSMFGLRRIMNKKDFLTFDEISVKETSALISLAHSLKCLEKNVYKLARS